MVMRKSLAVVLAAFVLLVVCFSLPASAAPDVRTIVLNRTAVSLRVGESFTLKAQVAPFSADKSLAWVSSDESVATVRDGVVTGISIGKATVTVISQQNPSVLETAQILVVKPVEGITLEDEHIVLPRGETWDQIAYILPEDATYQRPIWSTSDKKVATVDENGVITAVNNGNCLITCAAADGMNAKAIAHVQVRTHEFIIREPGDFTVDFEMIEDEGTDEITKGNKTLKDNWQKTVTFENGVLEKVSDTSVRPLKAGSEIVHLREIHTQSGKKKITKESYHFIFVEKNAVRQAGSVPQEDSNGEIRFRDIPWGLRYKEVKSILSARKEKLKSPITRNGMLWTQIDGEIAFGDFVAYKNGLSFSSSSANVENLTANLQKTAFVMGDYYFEKTIPFENLKLNVMKTYDLPENETTSSGEECLWTVGRVSVHLFTTRKYTQLQIKCDENAVAPPAETDSADTADETASDDESGLEDNRTDFETEPAPETQSEPTAETTVENDSDFDSDFEFDDYN